MPAKASTNRDQLKALCLACAKEVFQKLKARGKDEPEGVGPDTDWAGSTAMGPEEHQTRLKKAMKLTTTDELADYLDRHQVFALGEILPDIRRLLDHAERHLSGGFAHAADWDQLKRVREALTPTV